MATFCRLVPFSAVMWFVLIPLAGVIRPILIGEMIAVEEFCSLFMGCSLIGIPHAAIDKLQQWISPAEAWDGQYEVGAVD